MKKIIPLLMSGVMAFSWPESVTSFFFEEQPFINEENTEEKTDKYEDLSDPELLAYIEECLYAEIPDAIANEDYSIESIQAIWRSTEYLENAEYNSKRNVYYGFTQEEIEQQMGETPYVLSVNDEGDTIIVPINTNDNLNSAIITNIAIGSGVILICVTASVATGVCGFATISTIFAVSAKTGAIVGASSGALSGLISAAITGYESKDFDMAIKSGALAASEDFKWGAIIGSAVGGFAEAGNAIKFEKSMSGLPDWKKGELITQRYKSGDLQRSYYKGNEVNSSFKGATRPDIVRKVGNHIEAIEVKNYALDNPKCLNAMYNELEREISARNIHMPKGTTQRIVLYVANKDFPRSVIMNAKNGIRSRLNKIYPNIAIDVIRG